MGQVAATREQPKHVRVVVVRQADGAEIGDIGLASECGLRVDERRVSSQGGVVQASANDCQSIDWVVGLLLLPSGGGAGAGTGVRHDGDGDDEEEHGQGQSRSVRDPTRGNNFGVVVSNAGAVDHWIDTCKGT